MSSSSGKTLYAFEAELQEDLEEWLQQYNYERRHRDRGHRNMGRKPIEAIDAEKLIKEQTTKEAA
jgi:hypothetical protein